MKLWDVVRINVNHINMKGTLESPLECKEIKPVNPKENQYIGRADAEAEAPILWPPDTKI